MPHTLSSGLRVLSGANEAVAWLQERAATPPRAEFRADSRQLKPGDVFFAWPGAAHDARHHVRAALQHGARACLVEAQGVEAFAFDDDRIAAVPGLKAAAGELAHQLSGKPSQAMRVLAVTGTNGKTSTSWWLAQALAALGQRCAVAGTLGVGELNLAGGAAQAARELQATGLTTPDALALHSSLRTMRDSGVQACALEASSIGLQEHRLNALCIEVALFTNLTQDHLDYHGSMAAYWAAKRRLFHWPGLKAAVVNVDDEQGRELASELQHPGGPQLWTVALDSSPARLRGLNLRYEADGLVFEVHECDAQDASAPAAPAVTVRSPLVGRFNASNLLVVLGGLRALGVPLPAACASVARLVSVPGRMQLVDDETAAAVQVVVDYAHTPDALEKVLQSLAPVAASRQGKLWCLVGCGGDRDPGKRPLMGAAAARLAQQVVLTSDNPRSEDPARILQQMLAGISDPQALQQRVAVIEDRRAAIRHAVLHGAAGDVVLLAGKGHELTQEVNGEKRPFSDVEEARQALRLRAREGQGVGAC